MNNKIVWLILTGVLFFSTTTEARERKSRIPLQMGPNGRMGFSIDLYVSIKEDVGPDQFEELKGPLQETSERLYHATGGYFYIRSVKMRDRSTNGEFRFSYSFKGIPHGGYNIPMGPQYWWDRTIMHELGHLKLGLWDEYRYEPTCPRCVMALNSYTFCNHTNHKGHTKKRSDCWTRMQKLFIGLPDFDELPSTNEEHAPQITYNIQNTGKQKK